MLKNESFFRFNRVVLLVIMLLSLLLPLCDVHELSWESNPLFAHYDAAGVVEVGKPMIVEGQNISLGHVMVAVSDSGKGFDWMQMLGIVYIVVAIGLLIWKMSGMYSLYRRIHSGVLWKENRGGVSIYCHADDVAPFSWFNSIVISEKDYDESAKEILAHEMGHVRSFHSWDTILVNVCELVQWFNPFVWLMEMSLSDVHEYEADYCAIRSGLNLRQYQMLIIKKSVSNCAYMFANNFNHGLTKKRIIMMSKVKSNPWMRSKALYILPVAVVSLSVFATPEVSASIGSVAEKMSVTTTKVTGLTPAPAEQDGMPAEIKDVLPSDVKADVPEVSDVPTENNEDVQSVENVHGDDDKVFYVCEELPTYVGGQEAMMDYMMKNAKYPECAKKYGFQGRVTVQFVVKSDGTIADVHPVAFNEVQGKNKEEILKALVGEKKADYAEIRKAYEAMLDEAVRVYSNMPKWNPGKQRGICVNVIFSSPITFRLR